VVHHGRGLASLLRQAGRPAGEIDAFIRALEQNYREASLAPADRALLDYADKLTRTPAAISRADIDALRRHGFDDRAVHDLCAIVAYYAFVNRIADGLGVELEPPP